jgi:hypothetical protein
MEEFFLTLYSNSSIDHYEENSTASFEVKLPREIVLEGNWCVALIESKIPHTIDNVTKNNNIIYIQQHDAVFNIGEEEVRRMVFEKQIEIEENYYINTESLIQRINERFESSFSTPLFASEIDKNKTPRISVDLKKIGANMQDGKLVKDDKLIDTKKGEKLTQKLVKREIFFQNKLANQLGFHPEKNILAENEQLNQHPANINIGIPESIFVYINLIESQMISDVFCQVLKIVKTLDKNPMYGDLICTDVINKIYLPVNKKSISSVKIELRSSAGDSIPFRSGISSFTLHFKKN